MGQRTGEAKPSQAVLEIFKGHGGFFRLVPENKLIMYDGNW
jgi:hypothetical protein